MLSSHVSWVPSNLDHNDPKEIKEKVHRGNSDLVSCVSANKNTFYDIYIDQNSYFLEISKLTVMMNVRPIHS